MKRVLLLLAVLCAAFTSVNAQKSSKFVTGTVSYTKTTDADASYSVSPTIGYYVTNKVSVGLTGEIGKAGDATTTNVGVFGRCDFTKLGKNCDLFSQLTLVSESSKVADVTTNEFNASLTLGGNYHINSKWALTMHVADLIEYESTGGKSTTTIGFSGINNPFATAKFGVVYKF